MGFVGQPRHPEVLETVETIIAKARAAGPFVGIALGANPDFHIEWAKKGVQWLQMGGDIGYMMSAVDDAIASVRQRLRR